jgi:plasmid stabilization system protein ParE
MQLRWTTEAAADLERIADYLFQHVLERAAELVRAVYDAPALLLEFPHRGRPGKKAGTRRRSFRRSHPAWRPAMTVISVRSANPPRALHEARAKLANEWLIRGVLPWQV